MAHPIQARNFFDRCIEAISPKAAMGRYAYRAQIALARSVPESSYRGAMATRSSTPWSSFTSYRGGTTADRYALASIRDRACRAYRENVVARGLLNAETDNIAAEGFSLQMRTLSGAFNQEAEDRFYKWLDSADITGKHSASDLFRVSWREPRKAGDGGFLLISRGGHPYLQYIPGDLIANPYKGFDPRIMFDGVECDPSGRPVRFWVRDVDEAGKDTISPVDARDFVFLSHLENDPLSIRGASVFAPIFPLLDQLDSYVDAVTKAAIMAAIFGLIERRRNPAAVVGALGTLPNSQGDQQKAVTLENGMLKVMGTDETMFQVQASQPMQQTPDFIRALMRLICLAFDMPIEIGQKDLSQVNFSGGRIGLIGYYRSCRVKQDWLKSRCWNRIIFWWLSKERQRQQLGYPDSFKTPFPDDYGTFELHGREWDYNDPQTEIVSDLIELDAGVVSPQQVCEKRGRDWRMIQDQIAEARQLRDKLGIPTLHSTNTRDERTQVTAVDANGNPVAGDNHLNGAQITAAVDVLSKSREGTLSDLAAAELLAQIGVPLDRAKVIVNSLGKLTTGTGDVAFKREVLKQLLSVPASREAVYNATDIEDLILQTGLSPEKGYEAPYIPVVASTGPLVSGAVINDPEGDIVGGDVENDLPDESVDLEQD